MRPKSRNYETVMVITIGHSNFVDCLWEQNLSGPIVYWSVFGQANYLVNDRSWITLGCQLRARIYVTEITTTVLVDL